MKKSVLFSYIPVEMRNVKLINAILLELSVFVTQVTSKVKHSIVKNQLHFSMVQR